MRRSEDLLADVADAFASIEDPAERVRLAFKLFDSEGVALVNLLSDGSGALEESGLLPDEVPIIARRGELVVPPERIVREQKVTGEPAPITVMINVTAADANSFRASQGQIAAEMARAIDRANRNR